MPSNPTAMNREPVQTTASGRFTTGLAAAVQTIPSPLCRIVLPIPTAAKRAPLQATPHSGSGVGTAAAVQVVPSSL